MPRERQRAGHKTEEKDRIKDLEREVRELRQGNEIPKNAPPNFGLAERFIVSDHL